MTKPNKVFISIYCKIYTDSFSDEMFDQMATGQDIYDFLMKDAQHCYDDNDHLIPGDCNLWYLGCNEKFGELRYGDKVFRWSFGESSFDRVEEFVSIIHKDGLFTEQQFQTLMDKINEGRLIDNMYDIGDYLVCKREGRSWSKTKKACEFRNDMKEFIATTIGYLQGKGYQVYY